MIRIHSNSSCSAVGIWDLGPTRAPSLRFFLANRGKPRTPKSAPFVVPPKSRKINGPALQSPSRPRTLLIQQNFIFLYAIIAGCRVPHISSAAADETWKPRTSTTPTPRPPAADYLQIIIRPRRTIEVAIQNPANPGEATMRNITVAVSDDSYRQARIWAAKNDASVSTVQDPFRSPGSQRNGEKSPTPPPLSSHPNQNRHLTYEMPHFTHRNKALAHLEIGEIGGEFSVFGLRHGARRGGHGPRIAAFVTCSDPALRRESASASSPAVRDRTSR